MTNKKLNEENIKEILERHLSCIKSELIDEITDEILDLRYCEFYAYGYCHQHFPVPKVKCGGNEERCEL